MTSLKRETDRSACVVENEEKEEGPKGHTISSPLLPPLVRSTPLVFPPASTAPSDRTRSRRALISPWVTSVRRSRRRRRARFRSKEKTTVEDGWRSSLIRRRELGKGRQRERRSAYEFVSITRKLEGYRTHSYSIQSPTPPLSNSSSKMTSRIDPLHDGSRYRLDRSLHHLRSILYHPSEVAVSEPRRERHKRR